MLTCSSCGQEVKGIRKERAGLVLLLLSPPFLCIFGLNAGSIIYSIMFLSMGLYWIITKPSKKYICKECIEKRKFDSRALEEPHS